MTPKLNMETAIIISDVQDIQGAGKTSLNPTREAHCGRITLTHCYTNAADQCID